MDNVATVEQEQQRRGQVFMQARKQLEREYNCTVTIAPKWEPGVSNTFVLSFDEQVLVGPARAVPAGRQAVAAGGPAPAPIETEEGKDQ